MNERKVKYKRVDSLVHGEVQEIKLIGEDAQHEKGKHLRSVKCWGKWQEVKWLQIN